MNKAVVGEPTPASDSTASSTQECTSSDTISNENTKSAASNRRGISNKKLDKTAQQTDKCAAREQHASIASAKVASSGKQAPGAVPSSSSLKADHQSCTAVPVDVTSATEFPTLGGPRASKPSASKASKKESRGPVAAASLSWAARLTNSQPTSPSETPELSQSMPAEVIQSETSTSSEQLQQVEQLSTQEDAQPPQKEHAQEYKGEETQPATPARGQQQV